MRKTKGMITSVTLARPTSASYKITIPISVSGPMGLAHKDYVKWKLDKIDGVWVATMHKLDTKTV